MITPKSLAIRALLMASIFCLLGQSALAQEDPGAMGPFAVSEDTYGGMGGFAISGTSVAIDDTAVVYYPSAPSQGTYPLVIFRHGNHATCYSGLFAIYEWPCAAGHTPIESYRGYAYIARALASHGYIVVSISNDDLLANSNKANGIANIDEKLIQHHLDKWNEFNAQSTSPFGSRFVGKVDMSKIGTMGHSRGGQAVAKHFGYNKSIGSSYSVRAILLLAPKNEDRAVLNDVSLGVILPYCDGDLADLQGVHYYDDARYSSENDAFSKHTFLVMGANHENYNTAWSPGTSTCYESDRLSNDEQQRTGITLITAFFRTYLGGEKQFLGILTGDVKPPSSATTATIHASYHPPAGQRLDVNRLDTGASAATNTLGGAAGQSGMNESNHMCGYDLDITRQQCLPTSPSIRYDDNGDEYLYTPEYPYDCVDFRQPHTTDCHHKLGVSQLLLHWDNSGAGSAWYQNQIPSNYSDIRAYDVLQFRAGVDFLFSQPGLLQQDFSVELFDGHGIHKSVLVSSYSDALFYPPQGFPAPGQWFGAIVTPKLFLNTVRIPLSKFTGVDLSNITAIRFNFDQTARGGISVSDIALAKDERLRALKIISLIPLLTAE